jgi:hypothetical protein
MAAIATANVDSPLAGCSLVEIGSAVLVEIPSELALRVQTCEPVLIAPAPAPPNCLVELEKAPKVELGKVLSPTQVRAFLNCSARWWFKYGLSEPEPKNSALALGSAVHRALEANFREKVTTKEDLDTLGVVALFRDAWHDQVEQTEFRDDEDPAALGKVGEQLVAKYMDEAAPWIQPAAVEVDVAGKIGGVSVRGKVDLLDEDGRVVDVKTAARKPSGIAPDYAFQLATYRQEVLYPLVQEGIANGLYFPNRQSLTCSRRNCAFWRQCEREFGGTIE